MHSIKSAAIPPTVDTAISGVSTPSSVGQMIYHEASHALGALGVGPEPVTESYLRTPRRSITVECANAGCTNAVYRPGVYRTCQDCQAAKRQANEGYAPPTPNEAELVALRGGWTVCWTAPNGVRRHLGVDEPLSAERTVAVLGVLQRQGINVVTIRKVG